MVQRIEVVSKISDTRAEIIKRRIENLGISVSDVKLADVYTFDYEFSSEELGKISKILVNPVTQVCKINSPTTFDGDWVIEIGFLPGVTDNIANTAQECVQDLLKIDFEKDIVFTSQMIFLKGNLPYEDVKKIAENFSNTLIQRFDIKDKEEYEREGMDYFVPRVKLTDELKVSDVDFNLADEELIVMGKQGIFDGNMRRGPLALDLNSMKEIKRYFLEKENRVPKDIEVEAIAQTWSEHCKHTIFASEMDEIKDGIYREYIKKSTERIRNEKGDDDFCVSVFKDNSGGIVFDDDYIITDKVETHNSPSALDPFGGSITGIVGVNRDTIGFGRGAMPLINRYGFCFGYPEDKEVLYRNENKSNPALSPRRIMEGVISGVNVGGNCSGIPTPQGFVYFDDSYKGKPLIFVGTVGLIPKEIAGKSGYSKKAQSGDHIVMIGGRVGKDGIHGATFSSEALDSGSPATAVQIGDPITQKKLSDAVVKEARDLNLYNSITDNGAGGLSCSVSEMARECGGFVVDLEKVPVKYSGIQPWEIWVSESQERMTLAVPEEKINDFLELMKKRGVEATVIGKFNNTSRAVVIYKNEKILDMDMDFLHEGLPKKRLITSYTREIHEEPNFSCPEDLTNILLRMLSRHNIAGFEFISRQYDHEVQAGSILKPLQGVGEVNSYASVTRPLLDSKKSIVLSQGITSKYIKIDSYHMAACAIDTAIRNAIAAGCDLNHLALLDNFCWCSSDDPERLGQLKAAAKACYDYSVVYKTPFISGKDSMFNDFKGYDSENNKIKISVLPTLLISSIGVIENYNKAISLDAKFEGDLIYVIGETKKELGGSEYYEEMDKFYVGNSVPKVNAEKALEIYKAFNNAVDKEIISSSMPVDKGGLGVAIAKKCIGGRLGAEIDIMKLNKTDDLDRNDFALFSESQSRIVVTVSPDKREEFERIFSGVSFAKIGEITENDFIIRNNNKIIVNTNVHELEENYKKRFKNY
ncbi:phosphoribosylformylglycinamidine synthase [Candidatus Pacearchaeota archaeon]|nr:phosphoribosylformylglycinamidine synthase [Candidatus Pacearchaeota archaeon]MBD3283385.1 phosphoribosylformylglycinamidine synthase [Candidatus Pacearchaeota archaeon]